MKTLLLTLFGIFVLTQLHAQNFEVSVQANSGLFHYSGSSAVSSSSIYQGTTPKQNATSNIYGNINGFSYGGDVQAQYVTKSGFIAGLQAGYDVLRSKVNINGVYPDYAVLYGTNRGAIDYVPSVPAKGATILQDQFINFSPYIGYRLKIKRVRLDLMPGVDIGLGISSYDKGKATVTDGTVYQTDLKRADPPTDVRLKFGIAATYHNWGVTASFAHGLTNYGTNIIYMDASPATDVHSELMRFGITYRLW